MRDYPRYRYHDDGTYLVVDSPEHEASMGEGWHDSPVLEFPNERVEALQTLPAEVAAPEAIPEPLPPEEAIAALEEPAVPETEA